LLVGAASRIVPAEIVTCVCCSGRLRIIANNEQPAVIAKIVVRLDKTAAEP